MPRVDWTLRFTQCLLGAGARMFFGFYLRRIHGLENVRRDQRCIFISNHVSLLDTILLGGLFWQRRAYPILVLGDKAVWSATPLHKLLSRQIGFLLERGKINPDRIIELETFGRSIADFQLVVFPEGTRGDGVNVAQCQPGIYHIAQAARAPIVPVFIANMQRVSTKSGRFHPLGGLRQIEVFVGAPIPPEQYLALERDEFTEFVRQQIAAQRPSR
ncbi:MAG: lysophospholipid acyltransferase family protein [Verrucomicrobiota bacterium]